MKSWEEIKKERENENRQIVDTSRSTVEKDNTFSVAPNWEDIKRERSGLPTTSDAYRELKTTRENGDPFNIIPSIDKVPSISIAQKNETIKQSQLEPKIGGTISGPPSSREAVTDFLKNNPNFKVSTSGQFVESDNATYSFDQIRKEYEHKMNKVAPPSLDLGQTKIRAPYDAEKADFRNRDIAQKAKIGLIGFADGLGADAINRATNDLIQKDIQNNSGDYQLNAFEVNKELSTKDRMINDVIGRTQNAEFSNADRSIQTAGEISGNIAQIVGTSYLTSGITGALKLSTGATRLLNSAIVGSFNGATTAYANDADAQEILKSALKSAGFFTVGGAASDIVGQSLIKKLIPIYLKYPDWANAMNATVAGARGLAMGVAGTTTEAALSKALGDDAPTLQDVIRSGLSLAGFEIITSLLTGKPFTKRQRPGTAVGEFDQRAYNDASGLKGTYTQFDPSLSAESLSKRGYVEFRKGSGLWQNTNNPSDVQRQMIKINGQGVYVSDIYTAERSIGRKLTTDEILKASADPSYFDVLRAQEITKSRTTKPVKQEPVIQTPTITPETLMLNGKSSTPKVDTPVIKIAEFKVPGDQSKIIEQEPVSKLNQNIQKQKQLESYVESQGYALGPVISSGVKNQIFDKYAVLSKKIDETGNPKVVGYITKDGDLNIQQNSIPESSKQSVEESSTVKNGPAENKELKSAVSRNESQQLEIDFDKARRAFSAVSFDPEKRATAIQKEFRQEIDTTRDKLSKLATTDDQKTLLENEIKRYEKGLLDKYNSLLDATSRTMNWAITGRGNFPVARNEKAMAVENKRRIELLEYINKVPRAIEKKINAIAPQEQITKKLENRYFKDANETLATVKGILEGSLPYSKQLITGNFKNRIMTLSRNNLDAAKSVLEYVKSNQDPKNKVFADNNSIWKLLEQSEKPVESSIKEKQNLKEYDGARIEIDPETDRVKLFFDEKPSQELINELKSHAWKWSPKQGVWQRKLTNNAEYMAKRTLDKYFSEVKQESGIIKEKGVNENVKETKEQGRLLKEISREITNRGRSESSEREIERSRVYETFGKSKVLFFDENEGEYLADAYYDANSDTIYLNSNPEYGDDFAYLHELFHKIVANKPDSYTDLLESVLNRALSNNNIYEWMVENRIMDEDKAIYESEEGKKAIIEEFFADVYADHIISQNDVFKPSPETDDNKRLEHFGFATYEIESILSAMDQLIKNDPVDQQRTELNDRLNFFEGKTPNRHKPLGVISDGFKPKGMNEKFEFSDPEVEIAHQENRIQPQSILSKLRDFKDEFIKVSTRTFRELDENNPQMAEARKELINYKKLKEQSGFEAVKVIESITSKEHKTLSKEEFNRFERYILLRDLKEDMLENRALPYPYTYDNLDKHFNEIGSSLNENIREAIERRDKALDLVKDNYIEAMKKIGFDVKDRFQKKNYFRHQVLEYYNLDQDIKGSGKRVKGNTQRGFLKGRTGTEMSINEDYLQAEFETLFNMLYDTKVANMLDRIKTTYDKTKQLKREAKRLNKAKFNKLVQNEINQELRKIDMLPGTEFNVKKDNYKDIKALTGIESPLAEKEISFNKSIAINMGALQQMAKANALWNPDGKYDAEIAALTSSTSIDENINVMRYISDLASRDDDATGILEARGILSAIGKREKFYKDTLGEAYFEWKQRVDTRLIPDGYTTFQPIQGKRMMMVNTIGDQYAQALIEAQLGNMEYLQDLSGSKVKINQMLSIAGDKMTYIMPSEVVYTLENVYQNLTTDVSGFKSLVSSTQNLWKRWILQINPFKVVKYNIRNVTGDLDGLIGSGAESSFKYVKKATLESWDAIKYGNFSKEMLEFYERGGFQSNFYIQEIVDINNHKIFDRFKNKKLLDKALIPLNNYVDFTGDLGQTRETIMRYAAYLNYKDQLKNNGGKPKFYGASNPNIIDGLKSIEDKAYQLSNDALGAYDQISEMGQALRKYIAPFWSWNEVNFKRYKNIIKNAHKYSQINEALGKQIAASLKIKLAGKSLAKIGLIFLKVFALTAVLQAWNRLHMREYDDMLPESVRNTPHLTLGYNKEDGTVIYFSRLGAINDLMEWFGLDTLSSDLKDLQLDRKTWQEQISDMSTAPINKLVNSLSPFIKSPVELLSGQSYFPDFRTPSRIRDGGYYIAQSLGLENLYAKAKDIPMSKTKADIALNTFVYSTEPDVVAYYKVLDLKRKFEQNVLNKPQTYAFSDSPKSKSLYYMKLAMKYGDDEKTKKYLVEYLKQGGTAQGLTISLKSMNPLYGLDANEAEAFMMWLTPEERENVKTAYEFYLKTLSLDN